MAIEFDRGNPQQPKGHALAYFRINTEPDKVFATYIVTLPVKADLNKYVPPFLASHLGNLPLSDISAFALPPMPEAVDNFEELQRLCGLRDDDLVYGGSMFSFDLPRMMESITELVQEYARLCTEYYSSESPSPAPPPEAGADDRSYQVNEVLYGLMSESDKLAELSRLLSKLRFAVEGRDSAAVAEATEEVNTLSRHLPGDFEISRLVAAAEDVSSKGSRLAQLYLDRCFRLAARDLSGARDLEKQIQALEDQS